MIVSLYESFPELSVEAFQESVAVVSVSDVSFRFAGVVGADLSPRPAELAGPLKANITKRERAANPTTSRERRRVVMVYPPPDDPAELQVARGSGRLSQRSLGIGDTNLSICGYSKIR